LDMFEKNRYVPSYSALLSLMTLAAEQLDQFKVVVSFILTQNVLRILKVSSTCNKINVMIQIQIQISFGFAWM